MRDVVRAYAALMKSGTAGRRLQRGVGRRSLHPIGAGRAGLPIARAGPDRNRPGADAAERRARDRRRLLAPRRAPPGGSLRSRSIACSTTCSTTGAAARRRRSSGVLHFGPAICYAHGEHTTNHRRSSPWKSPHFSSISADRKPTTRQVADLVKAGGADALTEATRRADAARYQEVQCRSALNAVKGMPFFSGR